MALWVSNNVRKKLATKHKVTRDEILECFANRAGPYLEDTRENHKTEPPTKWFISQTDRGRQLKVVFMMEDGDVTLKTTYEPNDQEIRIYSKHAGS